MRTLLFACILLFVGCAGNHATRGLDGQNGKDGATGPAGPAGPKGEDGQPGAGCTVVKIGTITNITCGDTTSQVHDGTAIETIELCPGVGGGSFREYLVRIDGQLYGVYASGSKVGMAKLWPGPWVTTDGRGCQFTVTTNGEVQ